MPDYMCDTCGKSYQYKRNLKRHVNEKHCTVEHWNCVEKNCKSKFIRRNYLSKHLILTHGYTTLRAKEVACRAPRGDLQQEAYYEDISEDDSVFDLIGTINEIKSQPRFYEKIDDFELDYLDNIVLESANKKVVNNDSEIENCVVTDGEIENCAVTDGEIGICAVTDSEIENCTVTDGEIGICAVVG